MAEGVLAKLKIHGDPKMGRRIRTKSSVLKNSSWVFGGCKARG